MVECWSEWFLYHVDKGALTTEPQPLFFFEKWKRSWANYVSWKTIFLVEGIKKKNDKADIWNEKINNKKLCKLRLIGLHNSVLSSVRNIQKPSFFGFPFSRIRTEYRDLLLYLFFFIFINMGQKICHRGQAKSKSLIKLWLSLTCSAGSLLYLYFEICLDN